jgi:hypothetical protein
VQSQRGGDHRRRSPDVVHVHKASIQAVLRDAEVKVNDRGGLLTEIRDDAQPTA